MGVPDRVKAHGQADREVVVGPGALEEGLGRDPGGPEGQEVRGAAEEVGPLVAASRPPAAPVEAVEVAHPSATCGRGDQAAVGEDQALVKGRRPVAVEAAEEGLRWAAVAPQRADRAVAAQPRVERRCRRSRAAARTASSSR